MLTSLIGFVIGLKKDYVGESKPPKQSERQQADRQETVSGVPLRLI